MRTGRPGHRLLVENVPRAQPPRADVPAKTVFIPVPKGAKKELFICPRCSARFMFLYRVHGEWACRTCHKLAYRMENADVAQRLWLQAMKGKKVQRRMRRLANS